MTKWILCSTTTHFKHFDAEQSINRCGVVNLLTPPAERDPAMQKHKEGWYVLDEVAVSS